jgi:hypothetical protein
VVVVAGFTVDEVELVDVEDEGVEVEDVEDEDVEDEDVDDVSPTVEPPPVWAPTPVFAARTAPVARATAKAAVRILSFMLRSSIKSQGAHEDRDACPPNRRPHNHRQQM